MVKYEKLVLRAEEIADFLKTHEGANIADAARALNLKYQIVRKGYYLAVGLNLIEEIKHEKGSPQGIRLATRQIAEEIADYLKSHESNSIADIARALNYTHCQANFGYHAAVRLNLIETGKFRQGRKGHLPATLEKITEAVSLRRQGKTIKEIGKDMGITGEMVRQLLGYAVKQGSISDKERADLNHSGAKQKNWAYFHELAGMIKNINAETYHSLAEKHWPFVKWQTCRANPVERKCLEALVQHADTADPDRFTKEDAELMVWVLHKIKQSQLSLSEIKKMADEYIATDITLPELGFKYGIATKTDINPSSRTSHYVRFAEKLNLISREDCYKKGSKTRSETCKKTARKYPEHIIKTAIESCEKGIPCSEVAKAFGIHLPTLNNYVYKNRKEQAESSEGQ